MLVTRFGYSTTPEVAPNRILVTIQVPGQTQTNKGQYCAIWTERFTRSLSCMLTRMLLYELYAEGPESTIRHIEGLHSYILNMDESIRRQQKFTIDSLAKKIKQLMGRIERLKAQLSKADCLKYKLTRRIEELQTELEKQAAGVEREVTPAARPDSHNSNFPPGLDLPGAKAANAIRRTKSLRRKSRRQDRRDLDSAGQRDRRRGLRGRRYGHLWASNRDGAQQSGGEG